MKKYSKKSGLSIRVWLDQLYRHLRKKNEKRDLDEIDMIIVTGEGIMVNDTYIEKERIEAMVDEVLRTKIQQGSKRQENGSNGTYRFPELGTVIRQKNGEIRIGEIEIQRESWLYREMSRLFVQQKKI